MPRRLLGRCPRPPPAVKNGHIKRITDADIQSSVLEIMSSNVSTTFITCPADPQKTLGIKLPFLVMIIKNLKKYFSFEVQVLDDKNVRRRFRASNYQVGAHAYMRGRAPPACMRVLARPRACSAALHASCCLLPRCRCCAVCATHASAAATAAAALAAAAPPCTRRCSQSTTRVKPFICTMPMRLDDGWNQIQFNLADFTRRAYGTNYVETLRVTVHANCRIRRIYFSDRLYSEEELPPEFKLFLPIQHKA